MGSDSPIGLLITYNNIIITNYAHKKLKIEGKMTVMDDDGQ